MHLKGRHERHLSGRKTLNGRRCTEIPSDFYADTDVSVSQHKSIISEEQTTLHRV